MQTWVELPIVSPSLHCVVPSGGHSVQELSLGHNPWAGLLEILQLATTSPYSVIVLKKAKLHSNEENLGPSSMLGWLWAITYYPPLLCSCIPFLVSWQSWGHTEQLISWLINLLMWHGSWGIIKLWTPVLDGAWQMKILRSHVAMDSTTHRGLYVFWANLLRTFITGWSPVLLETVLYTVRPPGQWFQKSTCMRQLPDLFNLPEFFHYTVSDLWINDASRIRLNIGNPSRQT